MSDDGQLITFHAHAVVGAHAAVIAAACFAPEKIQRCRRPSLARARLLL